MEASSFKCDRLKLEHSLNYCMQTSTSVIFCFDYHLLWINSPSNNFTVNTASLASNQSSDMTRSPWVLTSHHMPRKQSGSGNKRTKLPSSTPKSLSATSAKHSRL